MAENCGKTFTNEACCLCDECVTYYQELKESGKDCDYFEELELNERCGVCEKCRDLLERDEEPPTHPIEWDMRNEDQV